ncbi:MAG: SDR family oxidoreductase [Gammaproteobacteria bacterium]|nr:SDR family oxidoreductase [Gammaproteobacteria bacterium]
MVTNHNSPTALITGAAGGIGQALVHAFGEAGYAVIASDISTPPDDLPCQSFVTVDLQRTVTDEAYAEEVFDKIRKHLDGDSLKVLVNNAATQILGEIEDLTHSDWRATLDINLLAPFFWTQAFLPELTANRGSVINISSIHAKLTKPRFAAYATSKAALMGLTRSMALELGDRIRVNAIEPAAIDTVMLRAGFEGDEEGFSRLAQCHPTQCIGRAEEIGRIAVMLAEDGVRFLNGAVVPLDGGIGGRLCEP